MRQQLAFFLIAMITMSFAAHNDVSFLRSLKRQKYGKSLIEMVQLQLQTTSKDGNQIDNIVQFLVELRNQNTDEQEAHQERNDDFQAQESATQAELSEDIEELQGAIDADNNLLVLNHQTEQHLENYLEDQENALEQASNDLQENEDEQETTTQEYEDAFNALADQLTALAQAKQVLAQLQVAQPGSDDIEELFLQVSKKMTGIKLQHPKYQSMINVLAQLLQSNIVSDQQLVDTILEIITTLQVQLRAESAFLTAAYKQRIEDLQIVADRLQGDIDLANANIQETNERLAQLALDDSNAALRIQQNEQARDDAQDQYDDSVQAATDAQRDYDSQSRRRSDELAIINEVIEIFEVRFSEDVRSVVTQL